MHKKYTQAQWKPSEGTEVQEPRIYFWVRGGGDSLHDSSPLVRRVAGSNPALAAMARRNLEQVPRPQRSALHASEPPRRESALLSFACIRKKNDIKDQVVLYCQCNCRYMQLRQ